MIIDPTNMKATLKSIRTSDDLDQIRALRDQYRDKRREKEARRAAVCIGKTYSETHAAWWALPQETRNAIDALYTYEDAEIYGALDRRIEKADKIARAAAKAAAAEIQAAADEVTDKSVAVMTAAFDSTEAKIAVAHAMVHLDKHTQFAAKWAERGNTLNKWFAAETAPISHSRWSLSGSLPAFRDYERQQGFRALFETVTGTTYGDEGADTYLNAKSGAALKTIAERHGAKVAAEQVRGYLWRIAERVSAVATERHGKRNWVVARAKVHVETIWDRCAFTVVIADLATGEEVDQITFRTSIIINRSVRGKLFNQWPTRVIETVQI